MIGTLGTYKTIAFLHKTYLVAAFPVNFYLKLNSETLCFKMKQSRYENVCASRLE